MKTGLERDNLTGRESLLDLPMDQSQPAVQPHLAAQLISGWVDMRQSLLVTSRMSGCIRATRDCH